MSKGNHTTDQQEKNGKIVTRYDRKMEARRIAEEKERKAKILTKLCGILLCAAIVIGIVAGAGLSIYNKQTALNGTYIKIGGHQVTKLEYDYYYNTIIDNYNTMYSSYMGMMGLDLSKDLSKQPYSEVMSWKDYFDKMTVEQITQVKVLSDDAAKNGFTHDTAEEYQSFLDSVAAGAEAADITQAAYVKNVYGRYATVENVSPFAKENLLSAAYYTHLQEQNTPEEAEVTAYYEEHKLEYDTVDYRILTFTADVAEDASEDEISDALTTLSRTAEEMKEAVEAGGDFKALCVEFAQEDSKADYEDAEQDASLREKAFYSQTSAAYSEWLFDEARKEGDVTVASDLDNRECYVIEFTARNYDETTNDVISNLLATQRAGEYVDTLTEAYTLDNTAGKLEYLEKEEEQLRLESERAAEETDTAGASEEADRAEEIETDTAGASEEADRAEETEAAGTESE